MIRNLNRDANAPAVPQPTCMFLGSKEESEAQWSAYWEATDKYYTRGSKTWEDSVRSPSLLPRKMTVEESNRLYEDFVMGPFQFCGKLIANGHGNR